MLLPAIFLLSQCRQRLPIALHDADATSFPNLALMKLSAWHKAKGQRVEWYQPGQQYRAIYSSKVFTFTPEAELPKEAILGGTGYGSPWRLSDGVEHTCPDYALYGSTFSQGFLTRGCPNKCGWCIVPRKEGEIRAHADIEEFARHPEVVLMDNNVLAHDHGIMQIEKMARLGLKVDFNQGLDARRIDDGIARRLAALKWKMPLRLACDQRGQMEAVQRAVKFLRYHNCTPTRFFVYVLVKDIEDALERVMFLKGLGLDPFAQPYRDFNTNAEPTQEQRRFARWVNHKAIFKGVTWEEYRKAHHIRTTGKSRR